MRQEKGTSYLVFLERKRKSYCGLLLLTFVFISLANPTFCTLLGDYNNDGVVTMDDVVILYAWIQTRKSTDIATIQDRAKLIYPILSGTVVNAPSNQIDDINGDGIATMVDVVLIYAWIQTRKSFDFNAIDGRAKLIYPILPGNIKRMPGLVPGQHLLPSVSTTSRASDFLEKLKNCLWKRIRE